MYNQTVEISEGKKGAQWAVIAAILLAALRWLPILLGLNMGKGYLLNLAIECAFWTVVTIIVIKFSGLKSLGLIFDKKAFSLGTLWWALGGIAAASLCMINHFVIEDLPVVLFPVFFILSGVYFIIETPMQETFWRGFVQKRLEYFFPQERTLSIVATTLLWVLGWIPFFILIGHADPLWRVLFEGFFFGFAYYYTKRLSVTILGHFLFNIGFLLAHSYEFYEGFQKLGTILLH